MYLFVWTLSCPLQYQLLQVVLVANCPEARCCAPLNSGGVNGGGYGKKINNPKYYNETL